MEAGNISVEPQGEPVESLAREARRALEYAVEAKQIELSCEVGVDLPRVYADRDRVGQVFGNLIGNAVKFTPERGRIQVLAERDGERVRFSISDTGSGISPAGLPHVFDRFWQAEHSREGGAGLGLAIARAIVVAHRGEMWVESEPGRGSTFFFTLPTSPPDL